MTDDGMRLWPGAGGEFPAFWQSAAGLPVPSRVEAADERMSAELAFRKVSEGTALLWQGDYHQARQLLTALARRMDARLLCRSGAASSGAASSAPAAAFHQHRMRQAQRARSLGLLLIPLAAGRVVSLARAPAVSAACEAAGVREAPCVMSLRELLGIIGAFEWRKRGVPVPALGDSVYPHYGVFAPVRGEYVGLVAGAALPAQVAQAPGQAIAFDIGTGTGVLAALLARRGLGRVVATEVEPRALACARENLVRLDVLGHGRAVELLAADLFPTGQADLVVCNPPWLPAKATSPLERAVYDDGGRMLAGFLAGLRAHLRPAGEGWLVLSDLAEHLGLRSREALLAQIGEAGLKVAGREDVRPSHPKSRDDGDPFARARQAEVTSLWRLTAA